MSASFKEMPIRNFQNYTESNTKQKNLIQKVRKPKNFPVEVQTLAFQPYPNPAPEPVAPENTPNERSKTDRFAKKRLLMTEDSVSLTSREKVK